ncbi:MAG: hypothetical protein Q7K55_01770 [Candidatus Levybacteria bacterium]|nr:hypothetical protein [Candidatus Levybacteria bacterium]
MTVLFLGIAGLFIAIFVYDKIRPKVIDIGGKHSVLKHVKHIRDIKQEDILNQGREQFKKLITKHLNVPVTML